MFIDDVLKGREKQNIKVDGIVDITNVWQYCVGLKKDLEVPTDIFSLLPPFESTWFQFKTNLGWFGILAYVTKQEDGGYYIEFNWCIPGNTGYSFSGKHEFLTDMLGKATDIAATRIGPEVPKSSVYFKELVNGTNTIDCGQAYALFTALNFLYCKNVVLSENRFDSKLIKARQRRNKPYFEKTYTIAIEPMKKALNEEGGAQTGGIKQAFHICRGHMRTYDENSKGLFGKHHGTFWVPAHTRGDKEVGKVSKSYKLNTGKR